MSYSLKVGAWRLFCGLEGLCERVDTPMVWREWKEVAFGAFLLRWIWNDRSAM